jgi:hypothetical protein
MLRTVISLVNKRKQDEVLVDYQISSVRGIVFLFASSL